MNELEVKILEIDRVQVDARLEAMGAQFEFEKPFQALYFDYPDQRLMQAGETLRMRREGEETVLTHKQKLPGAAPGMKAMDERETEVRDFAVMRQILESLGLKVYKSSAKTRRQYHWGACHIVLDKYHEDQEHIPEFLEIEATSREELDKCLQALGYSWEDTCAFNAFELFEHYANPDKSA